MMGNHSIKRLCLGIEILIYLLLFVWVTWRTFNLCQGNNGYDDYF